MINIFAGLGIAATLASLVWVSFSVYEAIINRQFRKMLAKERENYIRAAVDEIRASLATTQQTLLTIIKLTGIDKQGNNGQ